MGGAGICRGDRAPCRPPKRFSFVTETNNLAGMKNRYAFIMNEHVQASKHARPAWRPRAIRSGGARPWAARTRKGAAACAALAPCGVVHIIWFHPTFAVLAWLVWDVCPHPLEYIASGRLPIDQDVWRTASCSWAQTQEWCRPEKASATLWGRTRLPFRTIHQRIGAELKRYDFP